MFNVQVNLGPEVSSSSPVHGLVYAYVLLETEHYFYKQHVDEGYVSQTGEVCSVDIPMPACQR